MTEDIEGNRKSVKEIQWRYKEGFIISFGLLLSGFVIEYFAGNIKINLSWPVNIYCGIIFILLLIFVHFYYRGFQIVRWLSTKYASVSIISVFSLLVLLIGFIPQDSKYVNPVAGRLGLNQLTSSWPFLLSLFIFCLFSVLLY